MERNIRMIRRAALSVATLAAIAGPAHAQAPTPVDLELALLVDVSGSVSTAEFNLQRTGYVNAFNDPDLFNNVIATLPNRAIAVSFVYWSSATQQSQLGGTGNWFLVNSVASSQAFAAAVNAFARPFNGGTEPDDAITFITPQFGNNAFAGSRWVIDVSGDGTGSNTATRAARDAALAAGVDAINGLTIGGPTIENWYRDNVIGGANSFVIGVDNFSEIEIAVDRKIALEVQQLVPEPSTYALMATGLAVLLGIARRRRAA